MYMSYITPKKYSLNNEWNTPKYVWDKIIPFISKDKIIWLPFYNDGASGKYLEDCGFDIVHNTDDFWESNHGDIVIDNPPYNSKYIKRIKEQIMIRLIELDKPFMLLLPSTSVQTKYFKSIYNEHFQLIIPKEKYDFERFEGDKTKCPFYTLWVCYKMGFEKDFYII